MPLRRGLGMNITSDMVKGYFRPSENPNQAASEVKFEKFQVGTTRNATRAHSGIATPHFSKEEVQYYEQQMTLSSNPDDVYVFI